MANLDLALIFVLSLHLLMFLGQASADHLNPGGALYFNCEGNMLSQVDKANCIGDPILEDDDLAEGLPQGEGSINPDTNEYFTDLFSSAKNWFTGLTGVKYLTGILTAPYNALKTFRLPNEVAFALGAFWNIMALFLIVAWFMQRQ